MARGHVGLGAIVPALQALGHEVIALPTVMLSNHPGHGKVAGQRVDPALLAEMLGTLDGHGWLASVDAVISGYLPTPAHVAVVADAVARVRAQRTSALFFCDPVIGDDPKGVYIGEDAARSLAGELVPMADYIFPNRFELAWLSGLPVRDLAEARIAAGVLDAKWTIATSIPDGPAALATVAIGMDQAWLMSVARQDGVPNGTGDLLGGLFAGEIVNGQPVARALGAAVAGVEEVLKASLGRDELQLIAKKPSISGDISARGAAAPWPLPSSAS